MLERPWRPRLMKINRKALAAGAVIGTGFLLLYWDVLVTLVRAWWTDDNYSHGFLIVPIAIYLAWERRARFQSTLQQPSITGLIVVIGSVCVLAAGVLGAELFLTRISIVGTVVGVVLFLCGWARLRVLAFPLAFLLLMIPLPAIIFNQIAFPLQLLASRVGESALSSANIPVLREGNVLILASTTLEVAEACSGIRSLVSLLTLGILYGYFTDSRIWVRVLIALSTIPVAIVVNAGRVAGTGIAVHYFGPEVTEGRLHQFAGWAVFVAALVLIGALQHLIVWFVPATRSSDPVATAVRRAG